MKRKIKHIVMIGSGNVATHLAMNLCNNGYIIDQVYSRTLANAKQLATNAKADFTNNPDNIHTGADLYIISVSDDKIAQLASHPRLKGKFVVHTAGSVPMEVLNEQTHLYGVLYPFQTFSKDKIVNFNKIPILIEASNEACYNQLKELASTLSKQIIKADSGKRAMLHIAAVFACNFTNHMYSVAGDILKSNHLPFSLLMPLIEETSEKIKYLAPEDAQTGPAIRKDISTIEKHLQYLKGNPHLQDLYKELTTSIQMNKKNKHER